jgi:hypothetical protein
MIRSIEINDDNGPDGIYELKIYSIRFQRVHNFFTKVGSDYQHCIWNEKTIEAAVLGELSAETLARIKTEDDLNFETRRNAAFAKAFAESALESDSEEDEPAAWKESDRRSAEFMADAREACKSPPPSGRKAMAEHRLREAKIMEDFDRKFAAVETKQAAVITTKEEGGGFNRKFAAVETKQAAVTTTKEEGGGGLLDQAHGSLNVVDLMGSDSEDSSYGRSSSPPPIYSNEDLEARALALDDDIDHSEATYQSKDYLSDSASSSEMSAEYPGPVDLMERVVLPRLFTEDLQEFDGLCDGLSHDGLSHDGDAFNRHEGALLEDSYMWATPPEKGNRRREELNHSEMAFPVCLWSGLTISAKGISEATTGSLSQIKPTICTKTCPRPKVVVKELIRSGAFLATAQPMTKADCRLRISEYGEATGIVSGQSRNNRKNEVRAFCDCEGCPFALGWSLKKREGIGRWVPLPHFPHQPLCLGYIAPNKVHTLTAAQTAPCLYQLVKDNPTLPKNVARGAMVACMHKPPSMAFVDRAIYAARIDIHGNSNSQAALIMSIKTALEQDGHQLKVLEMTMDGQRSIISEKDKSDHAKQRKYQKITKQDEGFAYVKTPGLFDALDKHAINTKFLYGFPL